MKYSIALLTIMALTLAACSNLAYYGQALSGHWQLMNQRRPVEEVLADPATSEILRQRLETARALRDFASTEMALPNNDSYRSYADLQRAYVVRNVFAAPALSLQPRQWCFVMVGCVSYRGYFDADAAQRLAEELRAEGYDVYVSNVPAYSTLGWFDDPLLNTFMHWPTGRLAELVFHELAHQRLYIADDTAFNESFATAVSRLGARLWLAQHGTSKERAAYEQYVQQREDFLQLVSTTRDELVQLYASEQSDSIKHREKRRLLANLQQRYRILKQRQWGGFAGYDRWFSEDLNNAKLAALSTYIQLVPAFEILFDQNSQDFAAFYQAVEKIGDLPRETRESYLWQLIDAAG